MAAGREIAQRNRHSGNTYTPKHTREPGELETAELNTGRSTKRKAHETRTHKIR